jgi:hypothetical protein
MNKGEIRTRILEQVDWQPDQSTSFTRKVDNLINRAYEQISLEAPFLFFEDECHIATQADAKNGSHTSDLLNVNTTDHYVLERTLPLGTTPASLPTGWTAWTYSYESKSGETGTDLGTWDGRMIELELSDGTVHRRQIREIWDEQKQDTTWVERITIDRHWPNRTDTGMKYRIYTPQYELPGDVIELRSARIYGDTHYDLRVQTQTDMERFDYVDYRGEQAGRPVSIFRGKHFQVDAPQMKPSAQLQGGGSWVGPDPAGEFEYCFTYVWGLRDENLTRNPGAMGSRDDVSTLKEPKWESSPSPTSAPINNQRGITGAEAVQLTLPNVDHLTNFYNEVDGSGNIVAPIRRTRSGLRKRIYVRRASSGTIASALGASSKVDEFDSNRTSFDRDSANSVVVPTGRVFYLLAEVEGHTETYTHDGKDIPDYYTRLKNTHGYQTIRFHPMPDARYVVDCRTLRRPQLLDHDQDAPRIPEEACEALIQKTLSLFYEIQGNAELSSLAVSKYTSQLTTLTKRYGMIPRHRPRKKFARVMRPYREVRVRYKE